MTRVRPFIIGLTGSVGMGKSTTAQLFQDEGAAIWDADAAVHRLYEKDGAGVTPIGRICPEAIVDGVVSRPVLKSWISADDTALGKIEAIIHPLVAQDRAGFLASAKTDIVVLDIPLLFETGSAEKMDMVVVVSAPENLQRERVLARPGMNEDQLQIILSKQMPDKEKRANADVVIPTQTLEEARRAVQLLVRKIKKDLADA